MRELLKKLEMHAYCTNVHIVRVHISFTILESKEINA